MEFVALQSRYLLSLLSDHVVLPVIPPALWNPQSTGLLQMSALELCHDLVNSLRPSGIRDCFSVSLHVVGLNPLRMISG